jgi:hypothetical protein
VTEPTQGTPPEPGPPLDPPPPEQGALPEPGITPGEETVTTPAPPAPEAPQAGWVQPAQDGGRSRGCCLILVIVGAAAGLLALVAIVGLIFLGSQVSTILESEAGLAGTVEFEAGTTSGCYVQQPATTFPASTSIHYAAHFEREVPAGAAVSTVVTYPDGTSQSSDSTYEESFDCIYDTIAPGLDPGSWTIEFRSGADVLATGTFEITP